MHILWAHSCTMATNTDTQYYCSLDQPLRNFTKNLLVKCSTMFSIHFSLSTLTSLWRTQLLQKSKRRFFTFSCCTTKFNQIVKNGKEAFKQHEQHISNINFIPMLLIYSFFYTVLEKQNQREPEGLSSWSSFLKMS